MGLKIVSSVFDTLDLHRPSHLVGVGSAIAVSGLFSIYGVKKFNSFREKRRLGKLTKRKQTERQAAFAELKRTYPLTEERANLLKISTDDLFDMLQLREVTAKEVLETFIAKSLEVNEALNCITEFIPQALDWAEELDNLPSVKGPLHGIPFCVKDDHDIEGMDSTLGYAKLLYRPAAQSAAIVQVLQDLGGVPFCKTNVPMSMVSFGSQNPVFGTTINAHFPERRLTPGGSSSGTGALVGAGGAIFGLGSDIGGSVRIPAHCNGLSTIRPTNGRFCDKGKGVDFLPGCVGGKCRCAATVYGDDESCARIKLKGVSGILTQRSSHLSQILKYILEENLQRKYDGTVVPVSWNDKIFDSKESLRIGYFTSMPTFPAIGSTEETVRKARDALIQRGHVLVPFDLPSEVGDGWCQLFRDFLHADLGENLGRLGYGEESSVALRHLWMDQVPLWVRRIGSCFLSWIPSCQETVAGLRAGFGASTGRKLWKCMVEKEALIEQVLSSMDKLQLDAILCPAFPFPALGVEHFHRIEIFDAITYTSFWNLVDMPAGIVRFGTETGENLGEVKNGETKRVKIAKKALSQSIGMPIGVQVVGKKFEEEMVLRLMNELDDIYQLEG